MNENEELERIFSGKAIRLCVLYPLFQTKITLLEQVPKIIHFKLLHKLGHAIEDEGRKRLLKDGVEVEKLLACTSEKKQLMERLKKEVEEMELVRNKCRELCGDTGKRDKVEVLNEVVHALEHYSGKGEKIPYPRILVVGQQSQGKSSVLSLFMGESIAVTGSNMCTRCPVVYELVPILPTSETQEMHVYFKDPEDEGRERRYTDVGEIRSEIVRRSDRNRGSSSISSRNIYVEVHSKNIPCQLTLVDLPGLLEVDPTADPGLKSQIDEMVKAAVTPKETIILAVSKAQETVTMKCMSLVREVDPDQSRTIGVITFVDCVHESQLRSCVAEVLDNTGEYQLKRGFNAMICKPEYLRLPSEEARRAEMEAFAHLRNKLPDDMSDVRKRLRDLESVCGVEPLITKLRNAQLDAIKRYSVEMLQRAEEVLSSKQKDLAGLVGRRRPKTDMETEDEKDKAFVMGREIRDFVEQLNTRLMGPQDVGDVDEKLTTDIYAGNAIHMLYRQEMVEKIDEIGLDNLSDGAIAKGEANLGGTQRDFQSSLRTAKALLYGKIEELRCAFLECGEKVQKILQNEVEAIFSVNRDDRFKDYPAKQQFIRDVVGSVVSKRGDEMLYDVGDAVTEEKLFLDASNPTLKVLHEFLQQVRNLFLNGESSLGKESENVMKALSKRVVEMGLKGTAGAVGGGPVGAAAGVVTASTMTPFLSNLAVDALQSVFDNSRIPGLEDLRLISPLLFRANLKKSREAVVQVFICALETQPAARREGSGASGNPTTPAQDTAEGDADDDKEEDDPAPL